MIEAAGVSLKYPDGTVALSQVDLKISPGEMIFITGPSGSGKTSLLKLLMGMEYPTTGSLKVLDLDIRKHREHKLQKMRRQIGPIFQEFRLIQGRTAMENVMLGMRFLKMTPLFMKDEALRTLKTVGLEHKIHTPVEHLSWGECQRVAIARAVARKPNLILADEPTGNLDKANAIHILDLLERVKTPETTVIITTHATHLIENRQDCRHLEVRNGHAKWVGGQIR